MKCFTIIGNECNEGINTSLIPVTDNLVKQDTVLDAVVVPITPERDDLSFAEVFKRDIHCASAICKVVFDKAVGKGSDRILVAYNPTEWFPSQEGGDVSDIVYRSRECFVALCSKGGMVFRKIINKSAEDNIQFEYNSDKPLKRYIPKKASTIPSEEGIFIGEIK